MTTLLLFLIPLAAWLVIGKIVFKHEFSWGEMGVQAAATAFVLFMLVVSSSHYQTIDYKLVNGVVTELNARKETCDQTWDDFPDGFCTNEQTRSVRDGETCTTINNKRTCTPKYKTQYRSIFPWEIRYFVKTEISDHEIKRVDRQGAITPPRFSEIKIGDPVTQIVSYTNYIKGASSTLFNQKYEDVPPIAYPTIQDYYKARRVIYFGVPSSADFVNQWNEEIAQVNADIRKTGANVIIAVTNSNQDWSERLAQAWDAHNINDVIVSIGVDDENIKWVDVRSWSKNDLVDITIRDEIMNLKTVDKTRINDIIKTSVMEFYEEQPMENFEYLAEDIPTPTWLYVIAAIILLVISPVVTFYFSDPSKKLF
jgi:hypothetical protein